MHTLRDKAERQPTASSGNLHTNPRHRVCDRMCLIPDQSPVSFAAGQLIRLLSCAFTSPKQGFSFFQSRHFKAVVRYVTSPAPHASCSVCKIKHRLKFKAAGMMRTRIRATEASTEYDSMRHQPQILTAARQHPHSKKYAVADSTFWPCSLPYLSRLCCKAHSFSAYGGLHTYDEN